MNSRCAYWEEADTFATTLREVVNANQHSWGAILLREGVWNVAEPALESIGFHQTYDRSAGFVNLEGGQERRVILRALPRRVPSPLYVL